MALNSDDLHHGHFLQIAILITGLKTKGTKLILQIVHGFCFSQCERLSSLKGILSQYDDMLHKTISVENGSGLGAIMSRLVTGDKEN